MPVPTLRALYPQSPRFTAVVLQVALRMGQVIGWTSPLLAAVSLWAK